MRIWRLNYRHGFHAGNHADALKHAALALALARIAEKPKPFIVIDAFAGAGIYDLLLDDEPARTGEWRAGVGRVWGDAEPPEPALAPWLDAVRAEQGASEAAVPELRRYPGSPRLALGFLREEDKLLAVERHPEEAARLRRALGNDPRARVYEADGWEALRSFLPPTPRRGLVIIDPPFEEAGEYDRMAAALADGLKRWATGAFLLWHAAKDRRGVERYLRAARKALGTTPGLVAELRVAEDAAGGLGASGVVLANPPFGVAEALNAAGQALARALADPSVETPWQMRWLTPPR